MENDFDKWLNGEYRAAGRDDRGYGYPIVESAFKAGFDLAKKQAQEDFQVIERLNLFMIESPGFNNVKLMSYVRKIEFFGNEVYVDYLEDDDDTVVKALNQRVWFLHYLKTNGSIESTLTLSPMWYRNIPPTCSYSDTSKVLSRRIMILLAENPTFK